MARPSTPFEVSLVERIEARFPLQSRHGLAPPEVRRDRAEHRILYAGPAGSVEFGIFGVERIRRVGIAIVPEDRAHAFSLTDAMATLDPTLHAGLPALGETPTEAHVDAWLDAHARFFHEHADALLRTPSEVFERVRVAAPPGERCRELVALCCELWHLPGYAPPQVIHWRHECELSFRNGALHLEVRLDNHEHAGVAEPFTVPKLELVDDESGCALPLTRIMEALDPEHLAARPSAEVHAMSLERLRPFLEHAAAFIAAHPEVFADASLVRELADRSR